MRPAALRASARPGALRLARGIRTILTEAVEKWAKVIKFAGIKVE
jgi:hypothetical protein